MPTQAKKDGNARHIAKLDIIKIQPYREEGTAIRAAAADAGKSVQGYVLEAVREKMERERAGAVPAGGVPAGSPVSEDGPGVVSPAPGRFPYISDDGDTLRPTVAVPPTQGEESSPAERPEQLSPDDWAVWARRRDDESLESWKQRLNRSHWGLSMVDIAKRLGKLSEHERNILNARKRP